MIRRRCVSLDDMVQPFKDYAKFHGYLNQPQSYLCAQFTGTQLLVSTSYVCCLREIADAQISNISLVVELKETDALAKFVGEAVNMRRFIFSLFSLPLNS